MRGLFRLILMLCCSLAAPFSQAEDFTPSERRELASLRDHLESSCNEQLKSRTAIAAPAGASNMLAWIQDLTDDPQYCACLGQRFEVSVTPELLRFGSARQSQVLAKRMGTECIVEKLHSSSPALCQGFLADAQAHDRHSVANEAAALQFCACVQDTLDQITASSFEPFMRSTVVAYRAYEQTGELPEPGSGSILATMKQCGLEQLKR
jgi:hypothetical protein